MIQAGYSRPPLPQVLNRARQAIPTESKIWITAAPLARLDYVAFFDPETLAPVKLVKPGTQMALAVFLGKTRLIDNAQL